jgi:hypothetical protein
MPKKPEPGAVGAPDPQQAAERFRSVGGSRVDGFNQLNAWCEIGRGHQSTRSAKARWGRPSWALSQRQKLCRAIFAAMRASRPSRLCGRS